VHFGDEFMSQFHMLILTLSLWGFFCC